MQCETLRPLSKRSTRDRACGVGHTASLPKRARSHGYHRLAHCRLIPPPSESFPPHDLSRGHADLLCLLDRLLAACRAVDSLRLSLTSDRRVFFGGRSNLFSSRACVSGDLQKKPSPFTTDHKHLIQNHLWVKASPYFPFTFTFTHCHYEPSRSDPRRSMYEKRIKHKVATQAVKAKVKEKGGEAFTSNQLYHNKFRRIGEEVKVKTQNSWMRVRTRTREDGEMYMSLKKRTCI